MEIVKLIGAAYKIPLSNILGSAGQTYFDTAYQIYNFLLTFSTAGLPLAISRMTSQAHAKGLENEKRRIFSTAIWLFFGLGLVCSVLMFFRADALARFLNNSLASTAVQALAPAVFCVCLLACMRGYTQGQAAGMVCAAHRPDCRAERRRGHCRRHSRHGRLHAVPLCLSGYP